MCYKGHGTMQNARIQWPTIQQFFCYLQDELNNIILFTKFHITKNGDFRQTLQETFQNPSNLTKIKTHRTQIPQAHQCIPPYLPPFFKSHRVVNPGVYGTFLVRFPGFFH